MCSIRTSVRDMMNWFTQAIACDLQQTIDLYKYCSGLFTIKWIDTYGTCRLWLNRALAQLSDEIRLIVVWVNTTSALLASELKKNCPPRRSGHHLMGQIGPGVRLVPVFKKCPPCGSVRVRITSNQPCWPTDRADVVFTDARLLAQKWTITNLHKLAKNLLT